VLGDLERHELRDGDRAPRASLTLRVTGHARESASRPLTPLSVTSGWRFGTISHQLEEKVLDHSERSSLLSEPFFQPFDMELHVPVHDIEVCGAEHGHDLFQRHPLLLKPRRQ
jgi:hypothetical protein